MVPKTCNREQAWYFLAAFYQTLALASERRTKDKIEERFLAALGMTGLVGQGHSLRESFGNADVFVGGAVVEEIASTVTNHSLVFSFN